MKAIDEPAKSMQNLKAVIRLSGYPVIRLSGYPVIRLSGYPALLYPIKETFQNLTEFAIFLIKSQFFMAGFLRKPRSEKFV